MKKVKFLVTIFVLVGSLNCKSTQNFSVLDKEVFNVIEAYFNFNKGKKVFVKTIQGPSFGSPLANLIEYDELNNSHNLIERSFGLQFERIFDEEEIIYLKSQIGNVVALDFNKDSMTDVKISKKRDINTLAVTVPVFSRDRQYAIMYVESESGGDLFTFKKAGQHWKAYTILSVWVS